MHTVLIVEDEPDIAELIEMNFKREGLSTLIAHDGVSAVRVAQESIPDVIVLDLMLPVKDGFGVFKDLRGDNRTSKIPVLMLTAKGAMEDRIAGLELGADDYLTKPFSPKELTLRVKALLKRTKQAPAGAMLRRGSFRLERNTLRLILGGQAVDLTATEFKLLRLLIEADGEPQTRDDLLREVWGYQTDSVMTRTLDTHVKRLREKLGTYAACIETLRTIGYRFVADTPDREG
jgi:two-component system, OmpR family, phosphate regulon response regulator PhoB